MLTPAPTIAYPVLAAFTAQMRELKAGLIQAITDAFTRKMASKNAPPEPVLPLRSNAGQYGIHCVGGVERNAAGQVVASWRGGGELAALQALEMEVLLNILGQMERGEYKL